MKLNLMVSHMNLRDVTSVIEITLYKVVQKIMTKMDFRYQTDVNNRVKEVCLVRKIYVSY